MVRKNRPRASGLFLMELILAILFFSLASAACVQIFVKAHLVSVESQALNHAVNECVSAAETFAAIPEDTLAAGTVSTYYDEEFKLCEAKEAVYVMTVTPEEADGLVHAHIEMRQDNDKILYEVDTARYMRKEAGNGER